MRDTNLTRPHAVESVLRFCSELVPRNVADKQTVTHLKMCVHVRQIHFSTIIHVSIILPPTHHTLPHDLQTQRIYHTKAKTMMTRALVLLLASAVVSADTTVEGVTFTDAEKTATLEAANKASWETLHYTFDLHDYKATNVVNGRTYATLDELAAVSGVNYFVLNLFKTKVGEVCPPATLSVLDAKIVSAAENLMYPVLVTMGGLSATAAEAVFRARPICSVAQLEGVLSSQEVQVLTEFVLRPGTCFTNDDCDATHTCMGAPHDNVVPWGLCVVKASPEGMGATCTIIESCNTGLVCVGLTMNALAGSCDFAWMGANFVGLSDATPTSTVVVPVYGQATVPVDALLSVNPWSVQNRESVKIVVEDPNGTQVTVFDGPELAKVKSYVSIPTTIQVPHSGDDTINGAWKIIVTNPGGVATGTLTDIKLVMTSRFD